MESDADESAGSSAENAEGAFVTMAGHDIGADGATAGSSHKKTSKRRLKKALQKYADENNSLREQLMKLSTNQNIGSELRPTCSSTMREASVDSRNDSLLMSTMNSWTLGALNVPECVPTEGEAEIDKRAFEYWKEILIASLQLVNSADEQAKFGVFKIKSGSKLREVFNTTVSTPEMPDERTAPFSNAIARLDDYFGSRTYILSQRGKLMNLCQSTSESSIEFVRRVSSAAKLCSYGMDEEMEAVVRVITKGATDSRVRVLAHRNWVKQGSMKDLIDLVRDRELEKANEEEFQRIRGRNEPATVASVTNTHDDFQTRGQQNFHVGWRGRGMQRGNRGPRRGGRGFNQSMLRNQSGGSCWRCGSTFHRSFACPLADRVCNKCGRVGHIARACSSSNQETQAKSWKRPIDSEDRGVPRKIAAIESKSEPQEDVKEEPIPSSKPVRLPVIEQKSLNIDNVHMHVEYSTPSNAVALIIAKVAGKEVQFMIDSGAQVNTITKISFEEIMADEHASSKVLALRSATDRPLKAYASEGYIKVIATFSAELFISKDRPVMIEKFYVVEEVRALLGFNTAVRYSVLDIGLNVPIRCNQLSLIQFDSAIAQSPNEFPKFNIPPITLKYNLDLPPSRNVYTHIPSAFKELTKQKLCELLNSGIIEEVTPEMDRSFCSSLLVVPKGKDDIRLVIDLRGPNRSIHRTPFKMPTFESIVMELHGAEWFSTIDLKNAFFHIELDKNSRHLTNFFAGEGIYRYKRLPFGLCNAPDIFQEALQTIILAGCEGVVNYLDDILIFGKTKSEHDRNLAKVKSCLENHNVCINEEKCEIGQRSVKFLGFLVSSDGWKIEDEKITALKNFRSPETLAEVKSFLGLLNFIEKFIPHRAQRTWRLRELARSERFYWNHELDEEFEYLKNDAWKSITTLGYYSRCDETELYVDASPYGLGAVLVQFDKELNPRVIACASKALTTVEQKYPQTQKEALAMVWGVEKFSMYLMSITFTIRTDSEANEFIFGGLHRIGRRAVTRAESWALRLQPYTFSVSRIPGNLNLADALSRLVKQNTPVKSFDDDVDDKHLLYFLDAGSIEISWNDIEAVSDKDDELFKIRTAIATGHWETALQRYESQAKHLRVFGNLIFKSDRLVLPTALREKAIQSAHQGHMGISSTKRIMREYFWWPGMSTEIESYVKTCETCLLLSKKNPPIPLTSRELPRGPWEILQIDFFTDKEFGYGEFLVIVDTYSRYLHVIEMKSINAESTIVALNKVFMLWGYPLVMQSDNGPPFQSEKFITTWENKGISIQKSIPLSPQSNGAIERQNQGIKRALAASKLDNINWRIALEQYVHAHNKKRPLSRLGVTPFELLVGWKYRGSFPCLWETNSPSSLDRDDIEEKDALSKQKSKKYTDARRGAKESDLTVGDKVVLTQLKRLKSDPTFGPEKYTILAREGAKIVVRSNRGVMYSRNVEDAKRVVENLEIRPVHNQEQEIDNDATHEFTGSDASNEVEPDNGQMVVHNQEQGVGNNATHEISGTDASNEAEPENGQQPSTQPPVARLRRNTRMPSKFDDMVLYHVYD